MISFPFCMQFTLLLKIFSLKKCFCSSNHYLFKVHFFLIIIIITPLKDMNLSNFLLKFKVLCFFNPLSHLLQSLQSIFFFHLNTTPFNVCIYFSCSLLFIVCKYIQPLFKVCFISINTIHLYKYCIYLYYISIHYISISINI